VSTETELKLALEGITAEQLQAQAEVVSHAVGGPRQRQVDSVYFDTGKLSLLKRGIALRLRRDGDRWLQTVKTSGSASAGLHQRGEWETAIDGKDLQLDLFDQPHLKKLFAKADLRKALAPVFTTVFQRTTWDLHYAQGAHIEMALDLGQIRAGGNSAPISEVELELIKGSPEDLLKAGRALADELPVRLLNASKADRGYRLAGHMPPPRATKAGSVELRKKASAERAFITILQRGIFQLQANEPLVLSRPPDIEGAHQMRVASRRMRSCLQLYRPLIPTAVSAEASSNIRRVTDALGPARDWDVFIEETLLPLRQEFPQHQSLQAMLHAAGEKREIAYLDAASFIESRDYTRLLLDLSLWLEQRAWRKAIGRAQLETLDRRARRFAREVLDRHHKKVVRQGRRFDELDAVQRHQLRIHCKRLRYAAEFFASLFGHKRSGTFIASLTAIQDVLGVLNDGRMVAHLLGQIPAECETTAADLVRGWTAAKVRAHLSQFNLAWNEFSRRGPFWEE
jgi:inorganic triphosphatase YgiF